MHPEISGDLLDRHPVFAVASDPDDVVAELLGIGPCHGDILPARPPWASDLRCHLSVQQTRSRHCGQCCQEHVRECLPRATRLSADGKWAYVLDFDQQTIWALDTADNSVAGP